MTKGKDARVTIALECTSCTRKKTGDKSPGIYRYTTQKNRRNTPTRLELKKYCPYCYKHSIYKELKR
uniref:Large ribosomal subunit protein bL33c n=1 Tax=Diplopterygium glaucum TaxID=397682 RepID=A0A059SS89_DIPGU|nr:ribosomal protein L33 [Diplopterygium glaucum]YP_010377624.1 ribosomal protein L33 [Diplopterygium chinense]AHA59692.1 ribosomal protein L33 [Diplopterygium glaucum]QYC92986.1 ribosomal protein L33 [Diplopterygium chinense]